MTVQCKQTVPSCVSVCNVHECMISRLLVFTFSAAQVYYICDCKLFVVNELRVHRFGCIQFSPLPVNCLSYIICTKKSVDVLCKKLLLIYCYVYVCFLNCMSFPFTHTLSILYFQAYHSIQYCHEI